MTPPLPIDEILETIKNFPSKEILTYLVTKGIFDYSKEGFDKIKKVVQDKYNEGKYAFVPDKEQANLLKNFSFNPIYSEISRLIPKYKYIDLIRTGLLLKRYNDNPSTINNQKIIDIKSKLKRRPNGIKLLKIANLVNTPQFVIILQHLQVLKLNGYIGKNLEEKFDEMVTDWEISSKLVEKIEKEEDIKKFCEKQIEQDKNQFFILGMKSAVVIVEKTINDLIKDGYFKNKGYNYRIKKTGEEENLKIEITIYKDDID